MEDFNNPEAGKLWKDAFQRRRDKYLDKIATSDEDEEEVDYKWYVLTCVHVGVGLFNDKETMLYNKKLYYNHRLDNSHYGPLVKTFEQNQFEEAKKFAVEKINISCYPQYLIKSPVTIVTPSIFESNINIFIDEHVFANYINRVVKNWEGSLIFI